MPTVLKRAYAGPVAMTPYKPSEAVLPSQVAVQAVRVADESDRYRLRVDHLLYGSDMTVAIAAFGSKNEIVTISDQRLSYGEIIPAADEGTMKNKKLSRKWSMMFAAEDATAFDPVIDQTITNLESLPHSEAQYGKRDFNLKAVMNAAQQAYEKEFNERFFREKLARFGFADIADFRRTGYAEMGRDLYHQYAMDLAKFDLGLELLVYGFDASGHQDIFEVANPGKVISHSIRGYAAIGSGSLMALAALNRRALERTLTDTIWRLFDAKFSSETARDVGRKTHVITLNNSGENGFFVEDEVNLIHEIWKREMSRPNPADAIKYFEKSSLVKSVKRKKRRVTTKKAKSS